MNQEIQNRNWNNLTEEKKNEYRDLYQKGLNYVRNEDGYLKGLGQGELNVIVDVFGEDNLLTKSTTPKTWEDVDDNTKNIIKVDVFDTAFKEILDININSRFLRTNIAYRLIATIQISKLIDLGYGGTVTKEEWENNNCRKYVIEYYPQDGRKFVESDYCIGEYRFIAFHTRKQRDEFMSYPENRKLVEQFFMM